MANDAPSKTVLLERRGERDLVREGKSVLEDRRDLLAHMLVEQIESCEKLLNEARALWASARELLRGAVMRHGPTGLDYFKGANPFAPADWKVLNRLGTPWLESHREPTPLSTSGPATKDIETSIELAATRRSVTQLLETLTALAVAQNNLTRLVEAFRRTQRRVNALEHIILKDLNETIKNMEDRMDEMERDDLVRTLLIKRQQL